MKAKHLCHRLAVVGCGLLLGLSCSKRESPASAPTSRSERGGKADDMQVAEPRAGAAPAAAPAPAKSEAKSAGRPDDDGDKPLAANQEQAKVAKSPRPDKGGKDLDEEAARQPAAKAIAEKATGGAAFADKKEVDATVRVGARVNTATAKPAADSGAVLPVEVGQAVDTCTEPGETPGPLPRRCHLSSTYLVGSAAWQRRLAAIASLPPELAATALQSRRMPDLPAPESTALALDARLDRDHLAGPGQVWLHIALRSTDRWGMRRPPFDLAIVLAPEAAKLGRDRVCAVLQAVVGRVEPQDRLTVVWGETAAERLDAIAGVEAGDRIQALCAGELPQPSLPIAGLHAVARGLLAQHAAAQHRVAGTRLIVALSAGNEPDVEALLESTAAAVQEPTLTSVLLLGADAGRWWDVAETGHGALELAPAGGEAAAARALWQGWGRVVARLVRVDIRLSPGVVAQRVVGARVLSGEETRAVRRREQAIDHNLARVAGVASDRRDDGEGMTMLIPAFLGSDDHVIDVLLDVPGPGPVADVVLDYKDLVRMGNAKAMVRAALDRLPRQLVRTVAHEEPARVGAARSPFLMELRAALERNDAEALDKLVMATPDELPAGTLRILGRAVANARESAQARTALVALLDAWVARDRGCHVAPPGVR